MSKRVALPCLLVVLAAACATPSRTRPDAPGTFEIVVPRIDRPAGETPQWWFRAGASQAAARGAMAGRARNVILFVGDGMSLTTVAAARILAGQLQGAPGEETRLSWEDFPATALSRTYNVDSQTPDSAGTMSAMATGVKTRLGVLSIGQQGKRGDCTQALAAPMLSLWELAASAGLRTGVVTTTRLTHATPGATIAHSADRNWEDDSDVPAAAKAAGCVDIASQMIDTPHAPDVLMGGGRARFMPSAQRDPEYPALTGRRTDGRDLIARWQQRHADGRYVWNAAQLAQAPVDAPLLGLFDPDHMHYEHDRPRDGSGEPSLTEMTRAAIARLQRGPQGFVLLVEGGRIDHAHHEGNAYRALTETIELSNAVRAAAEMTSADDTLILVTADHSHTLNFVGYPTRGNPILGKVRGSSGEGGEPGEYARDATGLAYTTLSYANGPGYVGASDSQPAGPKHYPHAARGYKPSAGRPNLEAVDTAAPDYMQEALLPTAAETHGGDDVGIWARGPGSTAVRGNVEENTVYHFMLQAMPALREALCKRDDCDANGVPVKLPDAAEFLK